MIAQLFPTCLVNEFHPAVGMSVARVLERLGCSVVVPEGLTCCGQPAFNAGFHDEARRVAERGGAPGSMKTPARVAYHPSCHLMRGIGVRREPLEIIASIGAQSVAFDEQEECCGFGGLFSIKNADISASMMDRKLTAIQASGAERLVSCDLGCLLHLEGGLRRRGAAIKVQHLAELVDEALE